MLSKIEGAGRVEVVLSVSTGEEIVYQTDHETDISDGKESIHSKTILISDSQRTQNGLVKQINPPIYLGAAITCQGADNPVVKLAIVDAVSTLTGLGADRISVLKMK
jgi:stage III sporulation protein AG